MATASHDLLPNQEFRFEASSARLTLLQGTAEWLGVELPLATEVPLAQEVGAVFTYTGCRIVLEGTFSGYVAMASTVPAALDLHNALQRGRDQALAAGQCGPRVLVAAPTDHGKSTLCATLANYAARLGSLPTFVDLDVGQNDVSIPGTIAATLVDAPRRHFDEGGVPAPLVYYYGSPTPSDNLGLYQMLIERMRQVLAQRDARQPDARAAGLIVNTCGWVDGPGYDLVLAAIAAMDIDTVVVLGYDRLRTRLQAHFATPAARPVAVLEHPRSPGTVVRDSVVRRNAREAKLATYFYGRHRPLLPRNVTLNLGRVAVFAIRKKPTAPLSAMPIGHAAQQAKLYAARVVPSPSAILAISSATAEDQLLTAAVIGFLRVVQVDQATGKLACLAPNLNRASIRFCLLGGIKFMDSRGAEAAKEEG